MEPLTDALTYIFAALACIGVPPLLVWIAFNLPDAPEDTGDDRPEGDYPHLPTELHTHFHDGGISRE